MSASAVQVREVAPRVWSVYWTDGKGTLQAVVEGHKPEAEVREEATPQGSRVWMMYDGPNVIASSGKDVDDEELGLTDDDHNWGDL